MIENITKMLVINSKSVLPSDIVIKLYESNTDISIKETCFGVMVTGERKVVDEVLNKIRALDPYGIFIKERGLTPGETFRCRATRRGGARPGFHNLESEDNILPYIGAALMALDNGEIPEQRKKIIKLDVDKFKEIIEHELEVSS